MSTTASSSRQQASLSRIARLKANLGLKQVSQASSSQQSRRFTDANESEWYIPYNGPYEQPKKAVMGKVPGRDNWADTSHGGDHGYDPFERDVSASGHGGASTPGHGHVYAYSGSSAHGHTVSSYYEPEQRGRQMSPMSKYSESLVSMGERRSQTVTSPTPSPIFTRRRPLPMFLDLDAVGGGIGESPVPMQRVGFSPNSGHSYDPHEQPRSHAWPSSAPAPATSTRETTPSSFWTFGRKKSSSINAFSTRQSAESRPSTGTHQTNLQVSVGGRERSATTTGQSGDPLFAQPARQRANTVNPPAAPALASTPVPVISTTPSTNQPATRCQCMDDRPAVLDRTDSPYQRHPYATAVSPTGHRLHSQIAPSSEPKQECEQRRSTALNLNVPLLSSSKSFASLRNTARSLKASASTPNLRGERLRNGDASAGGSSVNSPGAQSSASTGTKWLHPETWCDALLFPRPRFRMRSHVVSPPMSPVECNPPYSAPPQGHSQPRTQKRSLLGGKGTPDTQNESQAHPSSAPPVVVYSNQNREVSQPSAPMKPEPTPTKTLRPPHPKSFAQDDLAIPSPVPSLATVLKQNEEFEKERQQWKVQADRALGNKRSRSLSRSRVRSKARFAGKPLESESDFAFSFDLIAASAFHGSQTLKPTIHFATPVASSGERSGGGTNTVSIGLNTTLSHSRNTSNASRGGSAASRSVAQGHSRKESFGKTAIRTARQATTGLCAGTEDLSPADEKVTALERRAQQDRTKFVHLDPERKDDADENVVIISAQPSQFLSAPQPSAGGPSLSPVPSDRSGESTGQSGVGIALSTPTALTDQPFQFSDHPYVTGPNQREIPRPAEYAGPHPSKLAEFSLNESTLSDISSRHRKPALQRVEPPSQHPFAMVQLRSRPTLRVPVPPPKKMFADVGTGSIREVLPDDIQYSPYSAQYSANSKRDSEALGVEEALRVALSRRDADDKNVQGRHDDSAAESEDFGSRIGNQKLTASPMLRSPVEFHGSRMPQIGEDSERESWQNPQESAGDSNFPVPTPISSFSFRHGDSPGHNSLESSPMTSPRQFKQFDDMEDYSDLFYRPGQSTTEHAVVQVELGNNSGSFGGPTPPNEPDRILTFEDNEGGVLSRPLLTRSNSALTNLRRKLSEEYGASIETHHVHVHEEDTPKRHVSEVIEVDEEAGYGRGTLAEGSRPSATLPLRLQTARSESPAHGVPEDVESSRASSILERYETEEGTDVYYRVGEVPALATPDPTSTNVHQASAHGSYIDTTPSNNRRSRSHSRSPDARGQSDHLNRPHLLQPLSANSTTRASYVTSTSSASRISQLSDFPVPPGQPTLTPGSIIQSYFASTPDASEQRASLADDHASDEGKRQERQERRTTFGPVSDEES